MTTATPRLRASTEARFTHLLAATAIGVYLLVIVGASTALLDGAAACPTWPACNGQWLVPLDDPALVAAWGHRVATLFVGALMLITMGMAWQYNIHGRVRVALGGALALYPVQIVLGALTVMNSAPTLLSGVHLVVAMAIFSGVLVALLWHLEHGTPTEPMLEDDPTDMLDVTESTSVAPPHSSASHRPAQFFRRIWAYVRLTKPKLWWLLCLVAVAAMGLAAGPALKLGTVVATLSGGVLAIGASGTFNNVLERDIDSRMERTADRPLVRGEIPVRRAVVFGGALAAGSVVVFVTFVNVLAAVLGLLAILFYSVVYTLILKPNTKQNIVIGGAVGAFPALIGWAAVENTVGMPAIVLGTVIFLWTPAHFYNLALAYQDDYERADFPMLPVIAGEATTRRHILLYLGATLGGAALLGAITQLDWLYAGTAALVSGIFLWAVVRLFRERTVQAAFRSFHASNAYLGSLLLAIIIDTLVV